MLFSALWDTALQWHVPVGVNARLAASACPTSATWLDSCRQLRFDPASVGADGRAGRRAAPRWRVDREVQARPGQAEAGRAFPDRPGRPAQHPPAHGRARAPERGARAGAPGPDLPRHAWCPPGRTRARQSRDPAHLEKPERVMRAARGIRQMTPSATRRSGLRPPRAVPAVRTSAIRRGGKPRFSALIRRLPMRTCSLDGHDRANPALMIKVRPPALCSVTTCWTRSTRSYRPGPPSTRPRATAPPRKRGRGAAEPAADLDASPVGCPSPRSRPPGHSGWRGG